MEFIQLNRFTWSVGLTHSREKHSTVMLEVASKKMEFIQLNRFTWSVGLTHSRKKHSTVMLEVASKMSF
ncbi:hypothetical protein Golax_024297 [Gossypium laxum]|uniref:Uncharacterized protein n=1 Tax=Gossypium laxum TaxID=34288 RepID=A0A7J8ZD38_9ROSI|nr:hypothetical protein [Gossypium laxum]